MRLRVWQAANSFHYAGTDRAMALWCRGLDARHFQTSAYARLVGGPRLAELRRAGLHAAVLGPDPAAWRSELRRRPCDLLHVHRHGEADKGWDALIREARRAGVRAVVETNVFGEARDFSAPEAPDLVYCVSAACLRRLLGRLRLGLEREAWAERFGVLYNPLDIALFRRPVSPAARRAARRALALPQDAFIAGRLGRPDPQKFPAWLLHAFGRHGRRFPSSRLLLMEAPDGALALAGRLGLEDRVLFYPASPDWTQVRRFYDALDALAHGSRVGESFGYTLAEAQALGLPVVADLTPWADNAQGEVVGHGQTGLLAMRPAAYARALDRLAADPGLRDRLGGEGRRRALARFGAPALTRALEGRYARLLQARGLRSAALKKLAVREEHPDAREVETMMRDYPALQSRRQDPSALADGFHAASSALRLHGRGWASRALKRLGLRRRAHA